MRLVLLFPTMYHTGVCNSVKANSQKSFVGHPTNSQRHTMMNHCDRYITHLQQCRWNWYIFYYVPTYVLIIPPGYIVIAMCVHHTFPFKMITKVVDANTEVKVTPTEYKQSMLNPLVHLCQHSLLVMYMVMPQ